MNASLLVGAASPSAVAAQGARRIAAMRIVLERRRPMMQVQRSILGRRYADRGREMRAWLSPGGQGTPFALPAREVRGGNCGHSVPGPGYSAVQSSPAVFECQDGALGTLSHGVAFPCMAV